MASERRNPQVRQIIVFCVSQKFDAMYPGKLLVCNWQESRRSWADDFGLGYVPDFCPWCGGCTDAVALDEVPDA